MQRYNGAVRFKNKLLISRFCENKTAGKNNTDNRKNFFKILNWFIRQKKIPILFYSCLLYTSDAADE